MSKQIKGKQKMILKNTIDRNAESEWRVCIDKMNSTYTNEKGLIYKNRQFMKQGMRIKKGQQIILNIYAENKEMFVSFKYLKKGRMQRMDSKTIMIGKLKDFDCKMAVKIFV